MTRDDLRGIIENITDSQLKSILDINSSDIGKAKKSVEELNTQLTAANSRIAELETSIGDADDMRLKIKELQNAIDDRNRIDAANKRLADAESRFSTASGDTKFINELTRKGIFAEFTEALEKDTHKGLSDAEIFTAITSGRDNLFAPDGGVPRVVSSTGFGTDSFTDNDIREIMGLPTNQ